MRVIDIFQINLKKYNYKKMNVELNPNKCFTIYVSVYNTHPLLEVKSPEKSVE